MMLATADELAALLRTTFTAEQTTFAEALLQSISDLVIGYCTAVAFAVVEDDEVVLRGSWTTELVLPGAPIDSVSSVVVDGTTVPSSEYELVGDTLHRSLGWGGRNVSVVVTYTHGFDAVPGDVKAVVLDRATRRWPNPEQIVSKNLDGVVLAYQVDSGGLTTSEKTQLRRYRHEARERR